ncbi:hypothetical protein [Actinokineospora sp. NBRC 105648]|uniref:hypothetical protein n=1 Tax=Actinokineospora sp. NBRC 105648 TaxID=3032206 RepID=UPI0024A41592|nr:hypothetical protein [Actinokineospora sp. NBRC 105648]GLZ37191.1 hypothetical protein Acsp05_08160 [Actinokineospora sp. NBRC 105648]
MISRSVPHTRVRSPLLDLVRLTRVVRRPTTGTEPVEVFATATDAPHLAAVGGSAALGICPDSPVRTRPLAPGSPPEDLAAALRARTARITLVSLPLGPGTEHRTRLLHEELDRASEHGTLVIASGATPGPVAAHPWVLPVLSCAASGRASWFVDQEPGAEPRGVFAPGEDVPGPLGPATGNGVAAAVVACTAALLWSLFPTARAAQLRSALLIGATNPRRSGPPLLDAERAHEFLARYAQTPRTDDRAENPVRPRGPGC